MTTLASRLAALFLIACTGNHKLPSTARVESLPTPRGAFALSIFDATPPPKAVALLASGDGGWSDLEEKIARTLSAQGITVVGWDCRKYADLGRYDRDRLCADVQDALTQGGPSAGHHTLPALLIGFSTGAEQMVSVAASPTRPHALRGVLLLAPGHRGRYGIELADLMGLTPKGPDTFSLEEMAPGLDGLRIFQIHGEHDPLAQTTWLNHLRTDHKLAVYPDGWHLFRGAPPDFLELVETGVSWILHG